MTENRRPMRIFPRNPTEYELGYQQGVFDMIARQEERQLLAEGKARFEARRREQVAPLPAPPVPRTRWQRWMDWLHAKLT